MKKLLIALSLIFTIAASTFAQTPPEAFSYSAVARDANSNPIAVTTIGIQISLRQGSPLGTIVYQENHFVNTDQFGLFNLTIGGGSVQSGVMTNIDWAAANYYLQVGMDANGTTNFLNMGSTQLLSVPYALYAKTAGNTNSGTLPTVGTIQVSAVSSSVATISANVTNDGGQLVTSKGVCWDLSPNPTVNLSNALASSIGTGAYTCDLQPLQFSTTYYARSFAVNSSGIAYGNQLSFTTTNCGNQMFLGTYSGTQDCGSGPVPRILSITTSLQAPCEILIEFSDIALYATVLGNNITIVGTNLGVGGATGSGSLVAGTLSLNYTWWVTVNSPSTCSFTGN